MDNSLKIEIRNYQRIKNAKIEFKPGLNLILGSSNQGKSSLFRALETSIFNLARESHITKGAKKAAVKFSYRNHYFIWVRDKDSSIKTTYIIDGKTYSKIGRNQLEELANTFGIKEVDVTGTKECLNFYSQMAYPFLLNRTPSELFKFFSYSSEFENLGEVQADMVQDFKGIKRDILLCKNTMDTNKNLALEESNRLNKLKESEEAADTILKLDSKANELNHIHNIEKDIKETKDNIEKIENKNTNISNKLNNIKLPKKEDIEKIEAIINIIKETKNVKEAIKEKKDNIKNIEKKIANTEDLSKLITKIETAELMSKRIEEEKETKNNIEKIESKIQKITNKLKNSESLKKIDPAKVLYIEELTKELSQVFKERAAAGELLTKTLSTQKEVEEELSTFKACPYCHSILK